MSNIRIDIASEFKDKGFRAAEKRTTSLTRKFDNLTRTAKRTFIAIAGFQALKRSVEAFAAEDRAAQRLATSLRNLGLAYNTKAIEDYLEQSEKATAINKDELSPAIAQLISTTLDAQKSMTLLNLAMDISTGTGKDLGSVTIALSRAYNGNFAALGKLQTAYTAAELEALGFEKTIAALSDQFQGAAQKNATTYSGKIELLKIAFGDLAEEIGKGIITFLTSLGSGDYDKGLQKLVNFGTAIGDVFRRAGVSIEYTKALLSTGFRIDEEEMRKLEEIRARFENPQAAANRAANNPAANRAFLADLRKQQTLQKKIEADRKKAAALAAKTEKERLKREKEVAQLKRAGTIFDMENIQIVAALQGKIDGEQRLRLVALLAINNDIADAAEKASTAVLALNAPALANLGVMIKAGDTITDVIGKLINAQAKVALLDMGITNIPKAKNPFEDWNSILKKIITDLDVIAAKIKGMPSATLDITAGGAGGAGGGTGAAGGGTGAAGGGTGAAGGTGGTGGTGGAAGGTGGTGGTGGAAGGTGGTTGATTITADAVVVQNPFNAKSNPVLVSAIADQIETLTDLRVDTEVGTAINVLLKEHIDTLVNSISLSALSVLSDEQAKLRAMGVFDTPGITSTSTFDPARFRRAENGQPPITIIVQGSLIKENDLSSMILNEFYEVQKAGQGITIDSTVI